MSTPFLPHSQELPVTYPPPIDTKPVFKLLENAWCAEYALRLTPLVVDEEYLNQALSWTFPQVYYAGLFSARALLEASGIPSNDPDYIASIMSEMAKLSLYADEGNLYHELLAYKIPECNKLLIKGQDVKALHQDLIDLAGRVAFHHERFLLKLTGREVFMENALRLPPYLLDSFLSARLDLLLTETPHFGNPIS